jgi:diguanylate cyclase (GGDEF)-like protein
MDHTKIDYSAESILIVDDDSNLRDILKDLAKSLGFSVETAAGGHEGLERLNERSFSFLLTDMNMPEMDGFELIQHVKRDFPDVSMVAMTGFTEGYNYVDVINAGASDFIKKPFDLGEMEAKLRRIINERNLRKELSRLSITDSLTGLYNQRHFYVRLKEEVLRAERQKHGLALILFDLDNFKAYNDTHGHLAGDEVLRQVGSLVNICIREGVDSGYRYGGDEFAVILIDADSTITNEIGKRIQEALATNAGITASVGYKIFLEGMTVKDLVGEADKQLYSHKNNRGFRGT